MAKFQGVVGFIQTEETSPGVWTDVKIDRPYTGDIIRNIQTKESSQHLNPDFNINNSFSIVADAYANENLSHIRYVIWKGVSWSVNSVEVRSPRLILSVRGVYNG